MAIQYEPIKAAFNYRGGDAFPAMDRFPEKGSQTFKIGVPLHLSSGYLQEVSFSGADIIYGISSEAGNDLSGDGTADEGASQGTPPNQSSAKIIPVGAKFKDGNIGIYLADGQTVFSIMLEDGEVFTQALIINPATLYGITKDSGSGFWFIDQDDTSGNNAVAKIISVDPQSPNTVAKGARVFFQFGAAKRFHD